MTWSEYGAAYDLAPYAGPRRTYLIATTQRTGSHYLAHLLGARGEVGVPFEYLNDGRTLLELQSRGVVADEESHVALLREMKERRTGSSGWFGIKAHWHTWASVLQQPLLAAEAKPEAFIYLSRRDRIAQAASLALAEQTGWWVDESQANSSQPNYSADHIKRALEVIEAEDSSWREYFSDDRECLTLTYEDVVAQPDAAIAAIYSHLGESELGRPNPLFPQMPARRDGIAEEWAATFRQRDARRWTKPGA